MSRLRDIYKSKVMPAMQDKYSYKSVMAVPKMEKVVVSMGVGKAIAEKKYMDTAIKDLTVIAGQKPITPSCYQQHKHANANVLSSGTRQNW